MATKPMPRIRAGTSGSPVVTSAKRSLNIHGKSKPQENFNHNKRFSSLSVMESSSVSDAKYSGSISNSSTVDSVPGSSTSVDVPSSQTSNISKSSLFTCNKEESVQIDLNHDHANMDKTHESSNTTLHPSCNATDAVAEVIRLRQMMMLHLSLISRQQDLLKLKDKEILQLKATMQSHESRLKRMERRISLSRRHNDSQNFNFKHQELVKPPTSLPEFESNNSKTAVLNDQGDSCNLEHSQSISSKTETKKTFDNSDEASSNKQTETLNDNNKISSTYDSESSAFLSPITSPVSLMQAAYSAGGRIPVPLSFIDRCHSQSAIAALPAGKNALPLNVRDSIDSPYSLTVNICNHCPHCATLAEEIKSSLPLEAILERNGGTNKEKPTPSNSSVEYASTPGHQLTPNDESLNETSDITPIQSKHSYYRHTWLQDENLFRFTDLDSNIEKQTSLNIPTWRIKNISNHTCLSHGQIKDIQEATDDEAYYKRHSRLEVSEKRRKRWDIQRIREYRYNEKLRLKLDKHRNITNDTFETFSPSLTNIIAIEVQDTLPINVFGYPLMSLKPEEFSLPDDF